MAYLFKQWGAWAPVTYEEDEDGDSTANPDAGCSNPDDHAEEQASLFWLGDRWGEWPYIETNRAIGVRRVSKKAAGRMLDGRTWHEMPGNGPETVAAAIRQGED